MAQMTKDIGQYPVFIYPWSQPDLLDAAQRALDLSRREGLTAIVSLSPTVLGGFRSSYDAPQSVTERLPYGKLSMAQSALNQAYIVTVLRLAALKPPYLCLATEINTMAIADPEEYVRLAYVYRFLYPIIKMISPETKVFVSFQWDLQRILDQAMLLGNQSSPLIDLFRPQLDVLAFTSYPSTHFSRPSDMPSSYYSDLNRHAKPGEEILFTELGWPSANGNEVTQLNFIDSLPYLFAQVRPKIVVWSLLHDVQNILGGELGSTGLITTDGLRKPSYAAFRGLTSR